jgi:hypothetical protein
MFCEWMPYQKGQAAKTEALEKRSSRPDALHPFRVGGGEFSVFVVLEAENLDRMKANDPAQINVWKMGEPYTRLNAPRRNHRLTDRR